LKKIKRIITKYSEDIVGNSIYDILKFIILLIFAQLIPTGTFVVLYRNLSSYRFAIICISIVLSIIALILFIFIYGKRRKFKFKILSMDITFEYYVEKVISTSKITVIPKRRGLDRIYNRYTWFPDEKSSVKCQTKGYKIKRLPQRDTSYEYDVCFGKKVKKGVPITYTVRVINENKNRHFKNFYSREIIAPMDMLRITLVIPSKYNIRKIYTEEIIGSNRDALSTKREIDFMVSYTWEIPNPKVGWEYKISW